SSPRSPRRAGRRSADATSSSSKGYTTPPPPPPSPPHSFFLHFSFFLLSSSSADQPTFVLRSYGPDGQQQEGGVPEPEGRRGVRWRYHGRRCGGGGQGGGA